MEDYENKSMGSSISEDSQPPMEVDYPLNTAVEVPGTDGGLFKTVLTEGHGPRPVKGSKVSVHYVGTLEDGTVFDSSRDRGQYFEFDLGRGQVIKGWDKGVATMRIGEKATLKCSPDYAYGAGGSPPKIPANATLLFEVELFHWTREVDISAAHDGSLMKSVLHDGVEYENPAFESKLVMDLRVYMGPFDLEEHKDKVPVKEMIDWKVEIGVTPLPPHLETFLGTMRKKEAAACRVRGSLIPDAVAEFAIPAGADRDGCDVTYVVEISELSIVKTYDYSGMEKVRQGAARKDSGNTAFVAGNWALAEKFYRRALEFIGSDYGFEGEEKEECHQVRIRVMGNLAQVLLNVNKFKESSEFSNQVLELDGGNTKALFRLAKAQDAMQDWDAAKKTLSKLLEIDAGNVDAINLRAHVQQAQKAYDQKQKSAFSKMFS